jgi:hypothetical protein
LPGGPLGNALNTVVAKNEMRKLFQFRQRRLSEILPIAARQAGII